MLLGRYNRSYLPKCSDFLEERIDDFIKNTIYYQLVSDAKEKGTEIDLPEEKVRQLCLAAGLLGQVANVDLDISDAEKQAIKEVLSKAWGLSQGQAQLVADISCHRTLSALRKTLCASHHQGRCSHPTSSAE